MTGYFTRLLTGCCAYLLVEFFPSAGKESPRRIRIIYENERWLKLKGKAGESIQLSFVGVGCECWERNRLKEELHHPLSPLQAAKLESLFRLIGRRSFCPAFTIHISCVLRNRCPLLSLHDSVFFSFVLRSELGTLRKSMNIHQVVSVRP